MDKEQLLSFLEKNHVSFREMINFLPLGARPGELWTEVLSRRRDKSISLPLHDANGHPYWYITTDRMVAASNRIIEDSMAQATAFDPFRAEVPSSLLEEAYFTSYVEGFTLSLQDAMAFLRANREPRDIREQLLLNNRNTLAFLCANLYPTVDERYLQTLSYFLTDKMDNGNGLFRQTDMQRIPFMQNERYVLPPAMSLMDRLREIIRFLGDNNVHPLIRAAVGQVWPIVAQPFQEGNERLGRMISLLVLYRAGYTFLGDVALSSLISRSTFAYYNALINILREENGGDVTYFIAYFLDLLAKAVEERPGVMEQRRIMEQTVIVDDDCIVTEGTVTDTPDIVTEKSDAGKRHNSTDRRNSPTGRGSSATSAGLGEMQEGEGGEELRKTNNYVNANSLPYKDTLSGTFSQQEIKIIKEKMQTLFGITKSELMRSCIQLMLQFIDEKKYSFSWHDLAKKLDVGKNHIIGLLSYMYRSNLIISTRKIKIDGFLVNEYSLSTNQELPIREATGTHIIRKRLIDFINYSRNSCVKKCVEALLVFFDNKQYLFTTGMLAEKTSLDKERIRICIKPLVWRRFIEPLKKEEGRGIVHYTFCDLSTARENVEAKELTSKNSEQIQNLLQKLMLSVDGHKKKVFIKLVEYLKNFYFTFSLAQLTSDIGITASSVKSALDYLCESKLLIYLGLKKYKSNWSHAYMFNSDSIHISLQRNNYNSPFKKKSGLTYLCLQNVVEFFLSGELTFSKEQIATGTVYSDTQLDFTVRSLISCKLIEKYSKLSPNGFLYTFTSEFVEILFGEEASFYQARFNLMSHKKNYNSEEEVKIFQYLFDRINNCNKDIYLSQISDTLSISLKVVSSIIEKMKKEKLVIQKKSGKNHTFHMINCEFIDPSFSLSPEEVICATEKFKDYLSHVRNGYSKKCAEQILIYLENGEASLEDVGKLSRANL